MRRRQLVGRGIVVLRHWLGRRILLHGNIRLRCLRLRTALRLLPFFAGFATFLVFVLFLHVIPNGHHRTIPNPGVDARNGHDANVAPIRADHHGQRAGFNIALRRIELTWPSLIIRSRLRDDVRTRGEKRGPGNQQDGPQRDTAIPNPPRVCWVWILGQGGFAALSSHVLLAPLAIEAGVNDCEHRLRVERAAEVIIDLLD